MVHKITLTTKGLVTLNEITEEEMDRTIRYGYYIKFFLKILDYNRTCEWRNVTDSDKTTIKNQGNENIG